VSRRIAIATAIIAGCALGAGAVLAADGGGPSVEPADAEEQAALAASTRFLDTYVEDDGRVSRPDQGDSTVSEGQAYGMLLAAAIGDRERFDRIWSWTRDNLQRPDGLLSSLWEGGAVVDSEPATDADLDAARALLVAGSSFDEPEHSSEAVRIGAAILEQETVEVEARPVLVAGPWARGDVPMLNPSYFDPRSFAALAAASGDQRWNAVAETSRDLVAELTAQPPALPPNWARVDSGTAVASGPPATPAEDPRYGFDAVRLGVRMGASCAEQDRSLAAAVWERLAPVSDALASEHALDGRPLGAGTHPSALVGAAGAAGAAGDTSARSALLARAEQADADSPSYYGAAWIALGRVMLTTDWLGEC
jgi:endo-1,4-beta-D-glucanase Y